jgi:elongation factor G
MPSYSIEAVRNIALVGHSGSGKTTLVESLLLHAGVIGAPRDITRENTVCDFSPVEKTNGHSLSSSVVSFDHGRFRLNRIDRYTRHAGLHRPGTGSPADGRDATRVSYGNAG